MGGVRGVGRLTAVLREAGDGVGDSESLKSGFERGAAEVRQALSGISRRGFSTVRATLDGRGLTQDLVGGIQSI